MGCAIFCIDCICDNLDAYSPLSKNPETYLVECKVLEERCPRRMSEEHAEHLLARLRKELLRITAVCHRLPLLGIAAPPESSQHSSLDSAGQ